MAWFSKSKKEDSHSKEKEFNAVFARVVKVLAQEFNISDTSAIKLETLIANNLGADSLKAIELTMAFEQAFNLEIPDTEAEKIYTVSDIVNYLIGRLK